MMLGLALSSLMMFFMRSSNCPRYFVPATMVDMSSATMRLSNSVRDTFLSTILSARPSTIALLPTPGSPMSTGLFFLRRASICAMRSISFARPTTGSSFPSRAAIVISVPNESMAGVSLAVCRFSAVFVSVILSDESLLRLVGGRSSSSSSSKSVSDFDIVLWVIDAVTLLYVTSF